MNNQQIQELLTVAEWGGWIRFAKKNNLSYSEEHGWPGYEFNVFYTRIKFSEELENEANSERGNSTEGSQPVVPTDLPKADAIGGEVELQPYDHIPERRETPVQQLSLPEPSYGYTDPRLADGESGSV